MSQFLPEVKMDFIPSDDDEPIEDDDVDEETGEKNPNFKYEEDKEEALEAPLPEITKNAMNVNEIFMNMPIDENVKLTKKGKPRKKRAPMSEEHKEKLKGAREKALEVRRKNANEKKEMKDLQKEEKELIKKSQIKKVNKLKEEVGIDIVVKESPEPKPPSEPLKGEPVSDGRLTKKDLEDAQLEAIIKYEMIRKQRKKEKYEKQKHEKEEAQVRETLMRAVAPQRNNYQSNNPFGNCY